MLLYVYRVPSPLYIALIRLPLLPPTSQPPSISDSFFPPLTPPSSQLTLVDSSGTTCKQLVKSGSDDMRQDNVIRQFFELLTGLLQHNRATAKQGLRIRTYKVSKGGVWGHLQGVDQAGGAAVPGGSASAPTR